MTSEKGKQQRNRPEDAAELESFSTSAGLRQEKEYSAFAYVSQRC